MLVGSCAVSVACAAAKVDEGPTPAADAGQDVPRLDVAVDDTIQADTFAPDAVEPADTEPPAVDSETVDTWMPPPDTYVPPPTLEHLRCESGAPRLKWSPTGCVDTAMPPTGVESPCVFRLAYGGAVRCMPTVMIDGHIKGVIGTGCTGAAWNSLLDHTAFPPLQPAGLIIGTGGATAWALSERKRPGAYQWIALDTCKLATVAFPYANASGQTVIVGDAVPIAGFVTTTL